MHNNENDIDDDDDCVMIGHTVPLPLSPTGAGLVKREGDDNISRNMPFIITVSIHFGLFYCEFIIFD